MRIIDVISSYVVIGTIFATRNIRDTNTVYEIGLHSTDRTIVTRRPRLNAPPACRVITRPSRPLILALIRRPLSRLITPALVTRARYYVGRTRFRLFFLSRHVGFSSVAPRVYSRSSSSERYSTLPPSFSSLSLSHHLPPRFMPPTSYYSSSTPRPRPLFFIFDIRPLHVPSS